MARRGENIYKRKDGRWEGRYTAGVDPETGKPIAKSVLADAARKGGLTERNADFLRYELSEDAHNVLLESPLREQIYYDVAPEGD